MSAVGRKFICYCFDYTEADIVRDLLEHGGTSTILQRILDEKKKGGCNCGTNHPQGR